jgi:hypothetical protein
MNPGNLKFRMIITYNAHPKQAGMQVDGITLTRYLKP